MEHKLLLHSFVDIKTDARNTAEESTYWSKPSKRREEKVFTERAPERINKIHPPRVFITRAVALPSGNVRKQECIKRAQ